MSTIVKIGNVALGEGRTKIIVPVTGQTPSDIAEQTSALADHTFDIAEWRVDFFKEINSFDAVCASALHIKKLLRGRPLIFTFRTAEEGGKQTIIPEAYARLNIGIIKAGLVDAVDIQYLFDKNSTHKIIECAHDHHVPIIGSMHDFTATPDMPTLISHMKSVRARGCDIVKIAVQPHDAGDVLTLMRATWDLSHEGFDAPLLTIAMDGLGLLSRISAPIFGSCATFAAVGHKSAPGQIPVENIQPTLAIIEEALTS